MNLFETLADALRPDVDQIKELEIIPKASEEESHEIFLKAYEFAIKNRN